PSHVLDYYRFSSDAWVTFQRNQVQALRRLSPRRWITHNFMGTLRSLDYYALAADLDFVSWDNYPTGNTERGSAALYGPGHIPPPHGYDVGDPAITSFYHALMVGLKEQPTWVMEQQPGYVNWGAYNPTPRPGVVRYWTLEDFAHGADAVVFFRWRACHYAQEQFHSGLLKHDAAPDQGYAEVISLADDRAVLERLQGARVRADVALLYSYEDDWAAEMQPHQADFSLRRELFAWFRAFQRAGIPVEIVQPSTDLARFRLVVAPTLWLVDDALASHLRAYVEQGGTLLIGPRSGFKTPTNLVWPEGPPGALTDLVGAQVTAFHSLPPGLSYDLGWADNEGATASVVVWAEALEPTTGVETVATWMSGLLAGQAAATLRIVGGGQVAYLGAWPTDALADQAVAWLVHVAGVWELIEAPIGVMVARRVADGQEYVGLINGTDDEQAVALYPAPLADAATGETWPPSLTLPPRSVRFGVRPTEAG
ncbi:MAG: beta-galactosidase, partial [Anaerolineae bacterium]|nr:beta-galactosidase [Anaerolineae bacterium]